MAKLKSGTRIYGTATVDGNLTAGNISATYIIGDGSQITGLPAGYTNSDVAAYLPTYTGNIGAGNINASSVYGNLISTSGTTYVTGNLIPTSNVTYDLGSSTQRWRDGWFSGTTIHIGNESLGVDANGKWSFTSNGATVEMGASVEFNPPKANISGNVVAGNFLFTNGTAVMSAVASDISTANTTMTSYVNSQISSVNTNKANLASPSFTGTVTSPNVVVGSNLYVSGDFTVTGNTTTINTESLAVNDPLIYMGEDNPSDLIDLGFVGSFTRNSFYQHTGFVRDATDQTWKLFEAVIAEPSTTIDFGGAVYSSLKLGSIETTGSANIAGNIQLYGGLKDASGSSGTAGQFLSTTGSGIAWTSVEPSAIINGSSNVTVDSAYVDIWANGTNSAQFYNDIAYVYTTLDVTGDVSVSGNVNANYLTGNGALLTGISAGPSYTAATIAPTSPVVKDLWYDTDSNALFMYINDGDSNQWVDLTGYPINISASTITGTTLSITGNGAVNGTFSSGAYTITGSPLTAIVNGGTNGVGNIGATGAAFNTIFAKATSATYADLAEIYVSDKHYIPGTVVVFGGDKEVTVSILSHDPSVAGVVSTDPAYLMNDSADGIAVALQGRVPCRVLGPVTKGDRVASSDVRGVAERLDMAKYQPGCIIGKALESVPDGEMATIEVVVGRV